MKFREGPSVRPVEADINPNGMIDAQRATGADLGDAAGLASIGRGISDIGEAADNIATDQARTWAATASAQQELNVRQAWQQKVNSLDPTSKDYATQIAGLTQSASDTWDDGADKVLGDAPNGYASKLLSTHLAQSKVAFQTEAMSVQAGLNAQYTSSLVQNGVSADSDLVKGSPDNATYAKAQAKWQATISGYKTVGPEVKAKLVQFANNQLANAQAAGMVQTNPGGLLKSINPGGGIQAPTTATAPADGFLAHLPTETQNYVPSVLKRLGNAPALNANGTASQALVKAVIGQESNGNPNAVSGKGAKGLMQVEPATAASMGLPDADLTDPAQNVSIGTAYLNKMLARYHGNVSQALAAYNAGPGNADKAISAGETATLPQVQPTPEKLIANAKPPLAGWDNLTFSEKVMYTREAEAAQGKKLGETRSQIETGVEDAHAMALNGVPDPNYGQGNFTQATFLAAEGPVKGPRLWREYTVDQQDARQFKQMSTMPLAQRNAMVQNDVETASGVGAQSNFEMAGAIARANARINAQIADDPIGYAITNGINGAKPIDLSSPANFMKSLQSREATSQYMTAENGAHPAIFSKQEAQQFSDHLATLPPDAQLDFVISGQRALTPKGYQTFIGQIAKGSPGVAAAGQYAIQTGAVQAGGQTLNGMAVGRMLVQGDAILHGSSYPVAGQKTKDGTTPELPKGRTASPFKMSEFQKQFETEVGPAAFQNANAVYGNRVSNDMMTQAADVFAAWARNNGVDTSDPTSKEYQKGVKFAVDAVTGGVWKGAPNGGALFPPWGMPLPQFQNQWNARAEQAFRNAGYDAQETQQILDSVTPVNAGNGRYQFMFKGAVKNAKGTTSPVTVDFSSPYVGAPPVPQTGIQTALSNMPTDGRI